MEVEQEVVIVAVFLNLEIDKSICDLFLWYNKNMKMIMKVQNSSWRDYRRFSRNSSNSSGSVSNYRCKAWCYDMQWSTSTYSCKWSCRED